MKMSESVINTNLFNDGVGVEEKEGLLGPFLL